MSMERRSSKRVGFPVLAALAGLYEKSRAGRTGFVERDFQVDFREVLSCAGCLDGDARAEALEDLDRAEKSGALRLERHRRDPSLISKVRVSPREEPVLFGLLAMPSPADRRRVLSGQFEAASKTKVSDRWQTSWSSCCEAWRQAASAGESIDSFPREDPEATAELLRLVPKLLSWQGESLIRFASCVLCGDSKRLGMLSLKLGPILDKITDGKILALEDLGIFENPRFVLAHGPLRLHWSGRTIDFEPLRGPWRIAMNDILAADAVDACAARCVTVENETTFHELAKLRSGNLLIQTSYPGSATLALLKRLGTRIEFWHFGDSDPDGFDILRDLRERSGLEFRSLDMRFRETPRGPVLTAEERNKIERGLRSPFLTMERAELSRMLEAGHKGSFEQESLGPPTLPRWPFYAESHSS